MTNNTYDIARAGAADLRRLYRTSYENGESIFRLDEKWTSEVRMSLPAYATLHGYHALKTGGDGRTYLIREGDEHTPSAEVRMKDVLERLGHTRKGDTIIMDETNIRPADKALDITRLSARENMPIEGGIMVFDAKRTAGNTLARIEDSMLGKAIKQAVPNSTFEERNGEYVLVVKADTNKLPVFHIQAALEKTIAHETRIIG